MRKASVISMAGCLLLCGIAWASPLGTVEVKYTDNNFTDGYIMVWGGGHNGTIGLGGIYILDKNGGTGQGTYLPDGLLNAFCIELPESPSTSYHTYDVVMPADAPENGTGMTVSPMGSAKQDYLRELWGRYYGLASTDGKLAEAFSAAVWEIVYEDLPASPAEWDVTVKPSGSGFKCFLADTTTANSWLHSLDGMGPKADLRALRNACHQDFLVEVPEPTTMALLAGGGVMMLLRRRRK